MAAFEVQSMGHCTEVLVCDFHLSCSTLLLAIPGHLPANDEIEDFYYTVLAASLYLVANSAKQSCSYPQEYNCDLRHRYSDINSWAWISTK